MFWLNEEKNLYLFDSLIDEKVEYFLTINYVSAFYLKNNWIYFVKVKSSQPLITKFKLKCGLFKVNKFYIYRSTKKLYTIYYKSGNKWRTLNYEKGKYTHNEEPLAINKIKQHGTNLLIDNKYHYYDQKVFELQREMTSYIFKKHNFHLINDGFYDNALVRIMFSGEIIIIMDTYLIYLDQLYFIEETQSGLLLVITLIFNNMDRKIYVINQNQFVFSSGDKRCICNHYDYQLYERDDKKFNPVIKQILDL